MEELELIKRKHNINEDFINAKSMDKENRIFKSDSYIIKLYYPKKYPYYYNELEVYDSLKDKDYLSKMYFNGEEENFKYIVTERLNGISLFDSWKTLSYEKRVDAVKQIAIILKDINNIRNEKKNFKEEFNQNFITVLNKLDNEPLKEFFYEKYKTLIKYLNNTEDCNLIHIDTHFYNFIYYNDKVYAYDFENTLIAPKDYQLIRWLRMWLFPEDFYYPKNILSQSEIDSYKMLMNVLLDNYTELNFINNLDYRVKLYGLYYLLQETIRCRFDEETVKQYVLKVESEVIK